LRQHRDAYVCIVKLTNSGTPTGDDARPSVEQIKQPERPKYADIVDQVSPR
jgi:hypothetical protein